MYRCSPAGWRGAHKFSYLDSKAGNLDSLALFTSVFAVLME